MFAKLCAGLMISGNMIQNAKINFLLKKFLQIFFCKNIFFGNKNYF